MPVDGVPVLFLLDSNIHARTGAPINQAESYRRETFCFIHRGDETTHTTADHATVNPRDLTTFFLILSLVSIERVSS